MTDKIEKIVAALEAGLNQGATEIIAQDRSHGRMSLRALCDPDSIRALIASWREAHSRFIPVSVAEAVRDEAAKAARLTALLEAETIALQVHGYLGSAVKVAEKIRAIREPPMSDKIDAALDALMGDDPRGAWDNKSRADMARAIAATGLEAENERLRRLLERAVGHIMENDPALLAEIEAALGGASYD